MGKLAQAVMHGAKIVQVEGNFDDCLELARKTTAEFPTIGLVNSVNPVRIEGQKTAAFEIVRRTRRRTRRARAARGQRRQHHRVLEGYSEYFADGLTLAQAPDARRPGSRCRPAGARAPGEGSRDDRHSHPDRCTRVVERCGHREGRVDGAFRAATDEEILEAYRLLAKSESSSSSRRRQPSIAGLLAAAKDGWLPPD